MGTQVIPESKSKSDQASPPMPYREIPRVGPWMWILLAAFLLPPAAVTLVGNASGALPHQTLWVILLGAPVFVIFITLPRSYELAAQELIIRGLFYKRRLPYDEILAARRISSLRAILHPGSLYCSDPSRALALERRGKRTLLISPRDPTEFVARLQARLDGAQRALSPEDGA